MTVRTLTEPDDLNALFDLRHRVLRPGRPPRTAHFEEDAQAGVIHIGAFAGSRLAGIASLYPEADWQLRGMAVEPDLQGTGVGRAVLDYAHSIAGECGVGLWCNARDTAIPFYESNGWVVDGDGFEVPDVGPHHVMRWQATDTEIR